MSSRKLQDLNVVNPRIAEGKVIVSSFPIEKITQDLLERLEEFISLRTPSYDALQVSGALIFDGDLGRFVTGCDRTAIFIEGILKVIAEYIYYPAPRTL